MVLGLATLVWFALHQHDRADPLVEPNLVRGRTFPASLAGSLLLARP